MNLKTTKQITRIENITQKSPVEIKNAFTAINNEAFPKNERCPLERFFELQKMGLDVDILGFFDNDELLGFFVAMKKGLCAYAWFFAIKNDLRSLGLGTKALSLIFDRYKNYQIVLDFEALDESAPNNEQRIHRKNFYLRNGFKETGYFQYYCETEFEIVCSEIKLDVNSYEFLKTEYENLLGELRKAVPMFHPKLYRKDN